jgi:hypothetical protein
VCAPPAPGREQKVQAFVGGGASQLYNLFV